MRRPRRAASSLESLETRIAPAAVFSYTDIDGDRVTVTTSLGTNQQLAAIITAPFQNLLSQELQLIDFTKNSGVFRGTDLSITARPSALGGDGDADIGAIVATGLDLGRVVLPGDLGRIVAGDANVATPALKLFSAGSIGRLGLETQAAGGTLISSITGSVPSFAVATNIELAEMRFLGQDAVIGKMTIGGSLIGGSAQSSGSIDTEGRVNQFTLRGSVFGGSETFAGTVKLGGPVAAFRIGGDLIGGGSSVTGRVLVEGSATSMRIEGDVLAHPGDFDFNGYVKVEGNLKTFFVGKSMKGGDGTQSGSLEVSGSISSVVIGHNLSGSSTGWSGRIDSEGRIGSVQIRGSVEALGTGSASYSVGIRAAQDIGAISVRGDVRGTTGEILFSASGVAAPVVGRNLAFGSVTVGGSVEGLTIFAGVIRTINTFNGITNSNADAQIGSVVIGGNFEASNILAGVQEGASLNYGTSNDLVQTGGDANTFSRIGRVVIGNAVSGTIVNMNDHFGIVAEQVGSLMIGGVRLPLKPGADDEIRLGFTGEQLGDVSLREL